MGICDANYFFTLIDIGAYGERSNGGIFRLTNEPKVQRETIKLTEIQTTEC